jgi:hypothetical protein
VEQQQQLLQQKYRYQPREPVVQQHYQDMGKGQRKDRGQGQGKGQGKSQDRNK